MKLHKLGAVATATLVISAAFAVGASPAQAGWRPACIKPVLLGPKQVRVHNGCPQGAGYYVQVIWASGPDSDCYWMRPGDLRDFWTILGTYDQTAIC